MGWIKNFMMKSWIALLVCVFCLCASAPAQETPDVKDAVVKIYTIYHRYNYNMPWQMKGHESRSGSGCIIKDRRILTNAHIVSDHAFIQVRRARHPEKIQNQLRQITGFAALNATAAWTGITSRADRLRMIPKNVYHTPFSGCVTIPIQYTVLLSRLFNPARLLRWHSVLFPTAKDGKTHAGIRIPPAQSPKFAILPVR